MQQPAEHSVIDSRKVSVHGGHSGQFCHHAKDSLREVIEAYIREGFIWVGITEHMPPLNDGKRYPDEAADGLDAAFLQKRFGDYIRHCRALQRDYADRIEIMVAFETETYEGSVDHVRDMVERYRPDYLVGSVHHVNGIAFDYDREEYQRALDSAGGIEHLYCGYLDTQYRMLESLKPAVVGHFDLIRIFDRDYLNTLARPEVSLRVTRNLDFIAREGLILDFNVRGFDKTAEQYPSMPVLREALARNIAIVPGDDSHGVSSVGRNYDRGLDVLAGLGVSGPWKKPDFIRY